MQEPETVLLTKYTFKDDIYNTITFFLFFLLLLKTITNHYSKKLFTRQFPNVLQLLYNKEKWTGNVYNKLILKCWQQRKIWGLVSINVKMER